MRGPGRPRGTPQPNGHRRQKRGKLRYCQSRERHNTMTWKHHGPSKAKNTGLLPLRRSHGPGPAPSLLWSQRGWSHPRAGRGWAEPPGPISHSAPGPEERAVVSGTSPATLGFCSVRLVAFWYLRLLWPLPSLWRQVSSSLILESSQMELPSAQTASPWPPSRPYSWQG